MKAGAVAPYRDDLTGRRFGMLVVTGFHDRMTGGRLSWSCACDCGTLKNVLAQSLRAGLTRSCGCASRQHGLSKSDEHAIWRGMISRCSNPTVKHYASYGGRGIRVCEEWLASFAAFLEHVGPRPSKKHSIERKDSNGNYEPGNVKWATPLEQANNKRNTRYVEYHGQRMALNDAVRAAGSVIHREAAWVRIKTGWTVELALETPRTMESPNSNARRTAA